MLGAAALGFVPALLPIVETPGASLTLVTGRAAPGRGSPPADPTKPSTPGFWDSAEAS